MEKIIEIYKELSDEEKIEFKEILNDILVIDLNKNYFLQKENEKMLELLFPKMEEIDKKVINNSTEAIKKLSKKEIEEVIERAKKKGITSEEDIKKIFMNIPQIIKEEFFGKGFDEKTHKLKMLKIYKGEINSENNSKFYSRRNIVDLLSDKKIIYISEFNMSREYKKMKKGEYYEELEGLVELGFEYLEKLKEKYGEDIVGDNEKTLENGEKKFELIVFKEGKIKELLKNIENIDNKKVTFEKGCLNYNGKRYIPEKGSNRYYFLELFFKDEKVKEYRKSEIINHLENGAGDFSKRGDLKKKLLDLYKGLNKTLENKLGLKDFFYIGKGQLKDYICINK